MQNEILKIKDAEEFKNIILDLIGGEFFIIKKNKRTSKFLNELPIKESVEFLNDMEAKFFINIIKINNSEFFIIEFGKRDLSIIIKDWGYITTVLQKHITELINKTIGKTDGNDIKIIGGANGFLISFPHDACSKIENMEEKTIDFDGIGIKMKYKNTGHLRCAELPYEEYLKLFIYTIKKAGYRQYVPTLS